MRLQSTRRTSPCGPVTSGQPPWPTKILDANIKDLDNMAVEPTANRKEENSDSKTLFASDVAAKEVWEFAKNRLNTFYIPKLHKPKSMMVQVRTLSPLMLLSVPLQS